MSCIPLFPCHDYCSHTTEQEVLTEGNFRKHIATWCSHGLSQIPRQQYLLPAVWDTALQRKQRNQNVSAPCLTNQLPNVALTNLRNSYSRKPGETVPLTHVDTTWKGPHSWNPGVENPLMHPLRWLQTNMTAPEVVNILPTFFITVRIPSASWTEAKSTLRILQCISVLVCMAWHESAFKLFSASTVLH